MNSERKNEIGADDSCGRVLKIREAATLALKELDQLRSGRRCVLHIRGVGGIKVPDSIFFARENRRPSHAQSDSGQLIGGSRVQPPIVTSQFYENLHELRYEK